MEKGLKNLQSIARAARKVTTSDEDPYARGNEEEHEGDSGIGCSDAEMEPADRSVSMPPVSGRRAFQAVEEIPMLRSIQRNAPYDILPRPSLLPLYQPPASAMSRVSGGTGRRLVAGPSGGSSMEKEDHKKTPDSSGQLGVSIKSILSNIPQSSA